jgi:hypothetical protein
MSVSDAVPLPLPSTLVIGGRAVDGRKSEALRYKKVCRDMAADIGGRPSAAQWILIQRCAGLSVEAENIEAKIASGEPIDPGGYVQLVHALARIATALGLKPRKPGDDAVVIDHVDPHTRALIGDDE